MTSALLAFLITIHPLFVDAASAAPEPAPTLHARVVVETSTLREAGAGPAIASRVLSSASAVLRAASIAQDGGPDDPVVAVTVRPFSGNAIGYTSTVAVLHEGRQLARSRQRCALCTEGELVATVERSLTKLAPRLRQLTGSATD
jgi:hypothetical protein